MSVAPSFFTRGSRIGLSPWSAAAMQPDELAALDARAEALGVTVSTIRRRDKQWMVRVGRGQVVVSLVARGSLSAVIAGALDDWEEATA